MMEARDPMEDEVTFLFIFRIEKEGDRWASGGVV